MKWCLPPKDISVIRNGSLTCNLFEGFIDFLSWKVLGISRGEDYLVLNSVALLERSFPYLDNATVTGLTTVPTCMPDART